MGRCAVGEVQNVSSVPHSSSAIPTLICLHRWKHIPERDWVGGINGHRVKLVFYCEQCLEIATRVVER